MEEIRAFFQEIINTQLFLLTLSVLSYYGAQLLYRRFPIILFTPIIIATSIIIFFLKATGIEYGVYYESNGIINFILGISVVCLSYLMHKNINRIKEFKLSIVVSTLIGSIVGVVSVIGLSYLFGCDHMIMVSLEPKSVTTPIALSLSHSIGGIPALTSLAVVVAGLFGNIVGVKILDICRITDPVARGLGLGSASHAVGTAKAMELGALEGAVGGAAIGLMGLFTSLVIPIINGLL
ncbi:MAG: LrgB family protein [Rikenellaceae bacterium]